jgi:hypothetical protein
MLSAVAMQPHFRYAADFDAAVALPPPPPSETASPAGGPSV